jgi:hypothetical protein
VRDDARTREPGERDLIERMRRFANLRAIRSRRRSRRSSPRDDCRSAATDDASTIRSPPTGEITSHSARISMPSPAVPFSVGEPSPSMWTGSCRNSSVYTSELHEGHLRFGYTVRGVAACLLARRRLHPRRGPRLTNRLGQCGACGSSIWHLRAVAVSSAPTRIGKGTTRQWRLSAPRSGALRTASNASEKGDSHMGMIYKRGAIWWLKYYANGRPIRRAARARNGAMRAGC